MKRIALRLFPIFLLGLTSSALATEDDRLKAVIAGDQRLADQKARDQYRHPYETLRFFGIRADMKVLEIYPGAGWYTQVLAPYLKDVEYIREHSIGSSLARYEALTRYFREFGDKLDVETLQELTRNHSAFPRSICAHGGENEPVGSRSRTVAAMVQVLSDRTMHITSGCACENDFHTVGF